MKKTLAFTSVAFVTVAFAFSTVNSQQNEMSFLSQAWAPVMALI